MYVAVSELILRSPGTHLTFRSRLCDISFMTEYNVQAENIKHSSVHTRTESKHPSSDGAVAKTDPFRYRFQMKNRLEYKLVLSLSVPCIDHDNIYVNIVGNGKPNGNHPILLSSVFLVACFYVNVLIFVVWVGSVSLSRYLHHRNRNKTYKVY